MKFLKLTLLLGFAPVCLYAQNLQNVTDAGNTTDNILVITGANKQNVTGSGLYMGHDPAAGRGSYLYSGNLAQGTPLPLTLMAEKMFLTARSTMFISNTSGTARGAVLDLDDNLGGRSSLTLDANGGSGSTGVGTGMDYFSITHYAGIKGVEMGTYNAAPISILTSATPRLTVAANGNVGIGFTDPVAKLSVNGDFATAGSISAESKIGSSIAGALNGGVGGHLVLSNPSKNQPGEGKQWVIYNMGGGYGNSLQFWQYDEPSCQGGGICQARMTITDDGNVGIGTTRPGAKLSVNGSIVAKKVKVSIDPSNWPDYVFEPAYKLPSLHELETFVRENKHLPEIPSAKEISTDGLDLGEVVKLQMKKIEELTLYILEQNKRIEALEAQQQKK